MIGNPTPIGAAPDRFPDATHRWMSEPGDGLPAWISFSWDTPVDIGTVELVFDTGMHRLLTLSMADGYTERMHWGKPQPETIRDYNIEALVKGEWVVIHEERSNFQRHRSHTLSCTSKSERLRLQILATNGIDHARLFEVRIYPHGANEPF